MTFGKSTGEPEPVSGQGKKKGGLSAALEVVLGIV
jgi:hypothetical protein